MKDQCEEYDLESTPAYLRCGFPLVSLLVFLPIPRHIFLRREKNNKAMPIAC